MTSLSGANLNNGVAVGPQGEGRESPSRFPKYPAYKDSGVEWLGDVPEHWEVGSLRRLIKSVGNGTTADQVDEAEDTVAVSRIETISAGLINFEKVGHVGPQDVAKRFLLNAGDILFSHINSLSMVGNVAIYSGGRPLLHGMNLLRIQPLPSISSEWLLYWLKTKNVRQEVESRAKPAINQASISTDSVRALPALIPPSFEQTQIARFLDHETARIDALIEEQQRLIELLKEKRQAVISHAVTKGLDPTVPMKDSGVEWLGEVPAHWVVRKLKNLVSVRGGSTPSKEVELYWEGEIPWVSPKDMKSERISDSIDHVSELAIKDGGLSIVRSGAVLIVVRGMILIHSVPVAITDVDVTINQDMKAMTPSSELSSDYLSLMLQGVRDAVFQYIDSSAHGTRKLEWERFELMDLPIPPHSEQVRVVRFIEEQKRAIDDLAEQAASAITLMNERRSALISAAVTGKIDVRSWQPPVSTQAPESAAEAN